MQPRTEYAYSLREKDDDILRNPTMKISHVRNSQAAGDRSIHLSIFTPRIWKIMIAGAYPFLIAAAGYFEALERTGTTGAFIADTLLPATLIGYCVLIFVLKKRSV
jgi:drug/metabolite transporter (DMT)-like permease